MKKSFCLFSRLIIVALLVFSIATVAASAAERFRSCTVKEVLKGGMYVYLRCQEGSSDIWLATVARTFKADEVIEFVDAPPMIDFYSKQLDRTFPAIILTDILKAGEKHK